MGKIIQCQKNTEWSTNCVYDSWDLLYIVENKLLHGNNFLYNLYFIHNLFIFISVHSYMFHTTATNDANYETKEIDNWMAWFQKLCDLCFIVYL